MAAKNTLTKAQLTEAAKLRDEGATWDAIRAKFGVKLGSSAWFRAFEREGIEYRAAGEPKPKATEPAKPQATKPKAVKATKAAPVAKATKAAPAKATRKPRVAKPKATAAAEVATSA